MNLQRKIRESVRRKLNEYFYTQAEGDGVCAGAGYGPMTGWSCEDAGDGTEDCTVECSSIVPGGPGGTVETNSALSMDQLHTGGGETVQGNPSKGPRRHDMEMARRRPYSARYTDMRGSRDMGKMNEEKKKKGTKSGEPCTCTGNYTQTAADVWTCSEWTPAGCAGNPGMTTKKDKKEMRESKYTRNRTNIERFLNEQSSGSTGNTAVCASPCPKQCSDLPIPQSWYDMVDTKGCNFVTNRMNNMQQRMAAMETDLQNPQGEHCNCQYKRLMCKKNYLRGRKDSLGC
mgnify:FL=1